ncbi:MAG TPA: hypothetical protein VNK04_03605 [Gemmataceae bacterium]|nr:hypothetical protein [Gemmataceae bacterium]
MRLVSFWRSWISPLSVAVACVAVAGCGADFPKTYPLSGTVLLPNGKPLPGGKIEFESVADPNLRGFGELEKDGTFARVYTYRSDGKETQGLIAGEHRVRFEPPVRDEEEGGGRDPGEEGYGSVSRRKPPLIDPRYRSFDTSGLKITIPAPDNRVTIQLSKPGH